MIKIVSLIVMILGLVEIQAQITIDLGRDTTYCSNSTDFTKVSPAKNLKITGDTTGAKFLWEAKGNIENETYDAADNLSNKTIVSPNFKRGFVSDNNWQKFKLIIEKNGVKYADSINLRVSRFNYLLVGGRYINLAIGDSTTLDGAGNVYGGISPFKIIRWEPETGLKNPKSMHPVLFQTLTSTSEMINYVSYFEDSVGCKAASDFYTLVYAPKTNADIELNENKPTFFDNKIYLGGKSNELIKTQIIDLQGLKVYEDTHHTGDIINLEKLGLRINTIYLVKLENKVSKTFRTLKILYQ